MHRLTAALNARMASSDLSLPAFPWQAVDEGPEALAGALAEPMCRPGELGQLRRRFWRSALREAHIAWHVAQGRNLAPDGVFALGLLHRVGRISCVNSIEHVLADGFEMEPKPVEFWLELVDRHHLEFGLLTSQFWGLPEKFSELVVLTLPELAEHDSITARLLRIAEQIESGLDVAHRLPEERMLAVDAADRGAVQRAMGELPLLLRRFSHDSDLLGDSWAVAFRAGVDPAQPGASNADLAPLLPMLEKLRDVSAPSLAPAEPCAPGADAAALPAAGKARVSAPFVQWGRSRLKLSLVIGLTLFATIRLLLWAWGTDSDQPVKATEHLRRGKGEVITEVRRGLTPRDIEAGRPWMVMVDLFVDGKGNLTAIPLGANSTGGKLNYTYTWFRGTQRLTALGGTISKDALVPGSYTVAVEVSDGKLTSATLRSAPLTIR